MIKTAVGPILVNTVEKDGTCAQQFAGLGQLQGVDVTSFTAALDGALIPAVLENISVNLIIFKVLR